MSTSMPDKTNAGNVFARFSHENPSKKRPRIEPSGAASNNKSISVREEDSIEHVTVMRYPAPLIPAKLHARYKRFLGDAVLPGTTDDAQEVIYVPNTGPMTGLLDELPASVYLSKSTNAKRKYAHTLEWIKDSTGAWVGVHSALANAMAHNLLRERLIEDLLPYSNILTEVKYGTENSRVDFVLEDETSATKRYVEVKSVTLAETDAGTGSRAALFPDTVSVRAQRHVRELIAIAKKENVKAALVFLVQRDDCDFFAPCHAKDKAYGKLVMEAEVAGVMILPIVCALDPTSGTVRYLKRLPCRLDYGLVE